MLETSIFDPKKIGGNNYRGVNPHNSSGKQLWVAKS